MEKRTKKSIAAKAKAKSAKRVDERRIENEMTEKDLAGATGGAVRWTLGPE